MGLLGLRRRRQIRRLNTNCYFRKSLHLARHTADKNINVVVTIRILYVQSVSFENFAIDRKNFYKNSRVVQVTIILGIARRTKNLGKDSRTDSRNIEEINSSKKAPCTGLSMKIVNASSYSAFFQESRRTIVTESIRHASDSVKRRVVGDYSSSDVWKC